MRGNVDQNNSGYVYSSCSGNVWESFLLVNTTDNLTYNILTVMYFSEPITPWSIGWIWEVVFGGRKNNLIDLSSQFVDGWSDCWSLNQFSFLQKQISCISLWPTLQTTLHSSKFFVDLNDKHRSFLVFSIRNIVNLSPTAFATAKPVMRILLNFLPEYFSDFW